MKRNLSFEPLLVLKSSSDFVSISSELLPQRSSSPGWIRSPHHICSPQVLGLYRISSFFFSFQLESWTGATRTNSKKHISRERTMTREGIKRMLGGHTGGTLEEDTAPGRAWNRQVTDCQLPDENSQNVCLWGCDSVLLHIRECGIYCWGLKRATWDFQASNYGKLYYGYIGTTYRPWKSESTLQWSCNELSFHGSHGLKQTASDRVSTIGIRAPNRQDCLRTAYLRRSPLLYSFISIDGL